MAVGIDVGGPVKGCHVTALTDHEFQRSSRHGGTKSVGTMASQFVLSRVPSGVMIADPQARLAAPALAR